MNIFIAVFSVFILNLPFGYWRANVKKFSLQWALAIHLSVPLAVAIRFISHLGFEFYTYPLLITAFVVGQFAGTKIYQNRKSLFRKNLSSCLVMDVIRSNNDSTN